MNSTNPIPKTSRWISYILQGLIVLMFLMGAMMNLLQTEEAISGATELGYPESTVLYLGLILLASTILYIIPRTAILGAILLTAWLGGAVATHIIHSDPLFNTLFPVVFGVLLWFALWLRLEKVKGLF
ncbi:DoxX family protein [Poritiphilus flavus]|uniref:DoxX family protein n=1 Tax=Poritiphilus flavus TaxID=2697053 RepID=A0A6L9EEV2_9FLAO|nr:DoxX family protein [Poritiphilus flavus]NAS13294.1 DoxX family protein [Poritiphilus flavus]